MAGVLLFGGSFDPIHMGHLITCRAAAEALGVDKVVLIPSAKPPHKMSVQLAPACDRVEMCRLAATEDSLFDVSDWEVGQTGPSFTLKTVNHFRTQLSDEPLYWLVGMDSLLELHTWYHIEELADACVIATVGRQGFRPDFKRLRERLSEKQISVLEGNILTTPVVEISSTEIRARVRARRSIRYLVPDSVRDYILAKQLYMA